VRDSGHLSLNQASQVEAGPAPRELLTVAEAAQIARRSVRTLRRAYWRGALPAYRDGNGRTIRIEYGDLRDWMKRKPASPSRRDGDGHPTARISSIEERRTPKLAENLRLLDTARERRRDTRRR
jgi:excisionase family DNA binding protein